jgi:hypothetical protein
MENGPWVALEHIFLCQRPLPKTQRLEIMTALRDGDTLLEMSTCLVPVPLSKAQLTQSKEGVGCVPRGANGADDIDCFFQATTRLPPVTKIEEDFPQISRHKLDVSWTAQPLEKRKGTLEARYAFIKLSPEHVHTPNVVQGLVERVKVNHGFRQRDGSPQRPQCIVLMSQQR